MREWSRGELQAFGSVAMLLLIGGIFVVAFSWLDREWLPVSLGGLAIILGLALRISIFRYARRTGRSEVPFRK